MMKKKFVAVGIAASMSVILSGCGQADRGDVTGAEQQSQLARYCGIDLDELRRDLKEQNPNIEEVYIIDSDCKTRIAYRNEQGERKTQEVENDVMMSMLAAGAIGALAGYAMGDSGERDRYRRSYRDRDRKAFNSPYVSSNSRAAGAYRTKSSASRIRVSSGKSSASTRSNSFKGTSSVARSSSYSGG